MDREEPVDVTVEGPEKSEDQVSDSGEVDNTSKESADPTDTGEASTPPKSENSVVSPTAIPSYLQDLFAGLVNELKESNQQLQRGVEQKINESNQQLYSRVVQKINESNQQIREDIRKENESLIKRFQLEIQKLSQDFSERLKSETTRFSQQIRLVQGDTERELVGVQKKLQGMSSEFNARLEQQS
jgi:flagellar biosynthesis GTPase FlhF